MALRELPSALRQLVTRDLRPTTISAGFISRRYASGQAAEIQETSEDFQDLESQSALTPTEISQETIEAYDPVKRSQGRKRELPASRYQYRSPRYYRGPLHPHQPPPTSDPASRQFVPGPFTHTRLEQTWQSTIAPDLMTLGYVHKPPGTVDAPKSERLRSWDGSSPYHKNRPKRGPRGPEGVLRLIEKDINFRNIPKIEGVTVHCMPKGAIEDSSHLHVAGMVLQSVTGVRPKVHRAKHSVAQFGIRERVPVSLTCGLRGNQAIEFVDKCINIVFPRLKDWEGIEGTTGDSSGNIAFGFSREGAILFPEVEINYDMYPPRWIPGFHVIIHTTATSDRHARLLLSAMGVPFKGKLVD
ncbi:putative mitochondrial 54S ribosomal protein L7 [Lachnellula arida]|uniref:Large ribosomal subunit protein uL5m n=1 Tax=Lachnellula arida TaxID=1316785 RepID=A0A8T9BNV0_9HELO|nr:putative mitochondrial 54S ribosomal protein L7 [Lachnellula arida]